MRIPGFVVAIVASTCLVAAQDVSGVHFEAATIKPNQSLGTPAGGRGPQFFARSGITPRQMMVYAWDLPVHRIVGGPSWLDSDRFDVLARANITPTVAQMRTLVQQLLADRFGLRTHREARDGPTYDLVFARSDHRLGSGLKPAEIDCTPFVTGEKPMSESPRTTAANGADVPRCGVLSMSMRGATMTVHLNGYNMARFADFLERNVNRPVIDRTGLAAAFDIEFTFLNESLPAPAAGPARPDSDGPSVSTALPEQLGLKIQSSRGAVAFLVVDAAARPSEN
jgi:uncharacterized protein (TIGR03435 family)